MTYLILPNEPRPSVRYKAVKGYPQTYTAFTRAGDFIGWIARDSVALPPFVWAATKPNGERLPALLHSRDDAFNNLFEIQCGRQNSHTQVYYTEYVETISKHDDPLIVKRLKIIASQYSYNLAIMYRIFCEKNPDYKDYRYILKAHAKKLSGLKVGDRLGPNERIFRDNEDVIVARMKMGTDVRWFDVTELDNVV